MDFSPGLNKGTSSDPSFVKVENSSGTVINPATEDTLLKVPGLSIPIYDYVSMALSAGDTTETYTFKTGGSGGSTVATVTVVYTSSARTVLSSVTKV